MLCLSIRQPYIGDIVAGRKICEIRSWPTLHRGPLLLHCSKGGTGNGLQRGAVVAIVDVIDCRDLDELFEWDLRNVRRIHPIPWRGNARFFKVPDTLILPLDGQPVLTDCP